VRLQLLITGKNNVELCGVAVDRVLHVSRTDPAAVDAGRRCEHPGRVAEPGTEPLEHDAGRTASADRPRSSSHRVHAVRGRRPARLHRGGRVPANEGARGPKRQVPVLDVRHHAKVDDEHDAGHAVGMRYDLLRTTHGGHLELGGGAAIRSGRHQTAGVRVRGVRGHRAPRARAVRGSAADRHVPGTFADRLRTEPGSRRSRAVPPRRAQNVRRASCKRGADGVLFDADVVHRMATPAGRPETVRRGGPGQTVADFQQHALYHRTGSAALAGRRPNRWYTSDHAQTVTKCNY